MAFHRRNTTNVCWGHSAIIIDATDDLTVRQLTKDSGLLCPDVLTTKNYPKVAQHWFWWGSGGWLVPCRRACLLLVECG
jgi:hypothetical protein